MSEPEEARNSQGPLTLSVPLSQLVLCVSSATDLMCSQVAEHHKRVAYISSALGEALGLADHRINDLLIAGALHDVGAFSLQERLDTLNFETGAVSHSLAGAVLLGTFSAFDRVAGIVRYHHTAWDGGEAVKQQDIPMESFIVHLADRIAILMRDADTVLENAPLIRERIAKHSGEKFPREMVDAFLDVGERESFWLDAASHDVGDTLKRRAGQVTMMLDTEGLMEFGMLVTRLIDFRSRFTSVHSRGVAACAEALADLSGFSESDRSLMRLAGYFHDLGKLVVPSEIIEKPSSLSSKERSNVKRHTFYTNQILESVEAFATLRTWAALHHERLDGTGYPFRFKGEQLPLGSRIMAVADVFTALTEDRPYRVGMSKLGVIGLMKEMAEGGHLDSGLVGMAVRHADSLGAVCQTAQSEALQEYADFVRELEAHGAN